MNTLKEEGESVEVLEEQLRTLERSILKLEEKKRFIVKEIENLKPRAEKIRNRICSLKTVEANNVDWSKDNYSWSEKVKKVLKDVFHFDGFKFKQHSAVNAILSGKDLILIMPTGGGKSLTYQLPALVTKGITLVVSPLLSLITDQINHLTVLGIKAVTINSTNSKTMSKVVYDAMSQGIGEIKLIYVTPEWLNKSKRFMTNLQKAHERGALDRIAIDEVHCCSMWGHDFRPDYKNLHIFKNVFPDVPIIGVTATATEKVILESQDLLGIHGCLVLKASYNRPNLFYKVVRKPSNITKCAELFEEMIKEKYYNESGIIYTHSVNDSIDLANELNKHGIIAAAYHASMEADMRDRIHNKWTTRKYQVICATVAFGMGIDKPDVRFVIHHSLPKSMENYYQESGRAGRDGKRAECILMYTIKDVFRVSAMVATSSQNGIKYLYEMVKYCIEPAACRRAMIATHFDEVWDSTQCNKHCDNCKETPDTTKIDLKRYYEQILKLIHYSKTKFESNVTALRVMDTWYQVGSTKKYRLPEVPIPKISRELGERVLAYLITSDYLKENLHFTAYTTISYIGKGRKEPNETIMFTVPKNMVPKSMHQQNNGHTSDYGTKITNTDKTSSTDKSTSGEILSTTEKKKSNESLSEKSVKSSKSSSDKKPRQNSTAFDGSSKSTSVEKPKVADFLTPPSSSKGSPKSPTANSPSSSKLRVFVQSYNAKKKQEMSPKSNTGPKASSSHNEVIVISSPRDEKRHEGDSCISDSQSDSDKEKVQRKRRKFDRARLHSFSSSSSSDSDYSPKKKPKK